jgi:hypothetical protein
MTPIVEAAQSLIYETTRFLAPPAVATECIFEPESFDLYAAPAVSGL